MNGTRTFKYLKSDITVTVTDGTRIGYEAYTAGAKPANVAQLTADEKYRLRASTHEFLHELGETHLITTDVLMNGPL